MSQFLPYGGFEWMNPEYYSVDKILEMEENQKKGFLFEVDLSYPVVLYEKHNDLPYCPENIIG